MAANAEAGAVTHGYSHMPDMPVDRKPSRQYKDVSWAVAFVAHLVGVVALGAAYAGEMFADAQSGAMGSNMGNSSSSSEPGQEIDPDVLAAMGLALKLSLPFLGIGLAVGLGWAIVWMALVQRFAEQVCARAKPVSSGQCSLLAAHSLLPTALLPTACCPLPAVHCLLPNVYCPLPCCPLPAVHCLLPIVCFPVSLPLPATCCLLPTA
ncbi:hypothetical protein T492DRAFT_7363 [Pavlovales sp. CCMP2436]|nr:hypothetical protein T492DRAFT_7363 [Pavlovales sp. CCMP2436]